MEIQTKYQVGQTVYPVWFATNTHKYVTKSAKVVAIFISVHSNILIDYTVDNGHCFSIKREEMIFETLEEAKDFLNKYNEKEWYACPICNGEGFLEDGMDCPGCYGEGAFTEDIGDEL
jgi:hypothetical protein